MHLTGCTPSPENDTWDLRPYQNNMDETRLLTTTDDLGQGGCIWVHLDGEIEANYDFLTITGLYQGHPSGEPQRVTGVFDNFIIELHHVDGVQISFTSDGSVVKPGVVVHVTGCTPSPENDTWDIRPYQNNMDETRLLTTNDDLGLGDCIWVHLDGEIEANYDFLTITGLYQGHPSGEPQRVTGVFDNFIIELHHVDGVQISFTSDGSVVKPGVVVHVTGCTPSPENDTWDIRPYQNNMDETRLLTTNDDLGLGGCILVHLDGEIEGNYDFLTITGLDQGNPSEEPQRVTGVFDDEIIELHHVSSGVQVRFTSDGSVTKPGVIVHVTGCP